MKISKMKWLEKKSKKKREEERKKLHSMAETSYKIIHRIPRVGDTTMPYDYDDILALYNDADIYAIKKIESGIMVDEMSGKFLKQDIEVRCMMLKALLIEWRERHRNARISINEEKRAYKEQLEMELKELEAKYNELCEESDKNEE